MQKVERQLTESRAKKQLHGQRWLAIGVGTAVEFAVNHKGCLGVHETGCPSLALAHALDLMLSEQRRRDRGHANNG